MKDTESPDRSTSEVKGRGQKDEATFEDAFELTGHGFFNHIVLMTSGLILLNVSMESVGISYVITAAECDLKLTSQHKGLVNAAAFIGIISSSFLWGYLGDKFGRRAVMLPAMLVSAVFSVASSFSTNVWMLFILRVITGFFVSASSATVYAYLGEMHTVARRAAAIAWGSAFISFSFIILPGLAWVIIPGKWSFTMAGITVTPWRVFVWSWCAPGLIAAGILMMLPESPRYLQAAKGANQSLSVLAKMYTCNFGGDFPVKKIMSSDTEAPRAGFVGALKNIILLFKPPLLKCVVISHISMFAVFMLASGLYMWVPDILNNILQRRGENNITICQIVHHKFESTVNTTVLPLNSPDEICETEVSVKVFPISMVMGAIFAITYLAIGVFINRMGRKILYCGIIVVCGAATVAAAFVPDAIAATALLILALCSGCAASILAAISVDAFPTCLRAMAMCVMYMTGRAGAAFGSNVLGVTLDTHCQMAFTIFGVFSAGSTILMVFWPKLKKVREQMESKGLTY